VSLYLGGISFLISKSFGRLQLVPEVAGLRLVYTPLSEGVDNSDGLGALDIILPLDAIGGLWATTRAFLYEFESLDENIILQGSDALKTSDALIKLYRDKPAGKQGKLAGTESTWLRIVTGRTEEERRRIKLGSKDLVNLELACSAVLTLAASAGTHKPERSS
jgi:hypothetical protein